MSQSAFITGATSGIGYATAKVTGIPGIPPGHCSKKQRKTGSSEAGTGNEVQQ